MISYRFLLLLYLSLSCAVFFFVGAFHLFRIVNQWSITVGNLNIPQLLSYTGLPGAIGACVCAIWLIRKSRKELQSEN